jgi:hypothetical protein
MKVKEAKPILKKKFQTDEGFLHVEYGIAS